ncbi:MAG: DUF1475 domain-containing protein [Planctomycetales bacterium]
MRGPLLMIFSLFFLIILFFTVRASLIENILRIDPVVLANRWCQATLADAYLGFATFYVWVAYRESSLFARVFWLVLILMLGNLAMSAYVVIQLVMLPSGADLSSLLLRPDHSACSHLSG